MKKILLAEDEKDLSELVSQRLIKLGHYIVISALDGKDAIEQARLNKPDLLLLDLLMPKMDGQEVIEVMQNDPQMKNIPIIVLTAVGNPEVIKQLKTFPSVKECLIKPFDPVKLMDKIKAILGERCP